MARSPAATGVAVTVDAAVPRRPVAVAADNVAVLVTGAAFVLISSKVNVTICCRRPSSSRSKSSAVRLRTMPPLLSRTTTSTSTRLTPVLNTGAGDRGAVGCG